MKTGLAITTYFREDTNKERLSIFKISMESLLVSGYPGNIFLIDDGSTCVEHIHLINAIDRDRKIVVIRRFHGGVARAKNSCIRMLLSDNIDIGFLADDDVLYKNPMWHVAYSEAIERTGMDHLSFYHNNKPCEVTSFRGYQLRKSPDVNGCFFTFTKRLIDRIGYLKILPNDYGHEHSNFSFRADRIFGQNGFFDIVDAKNFIDLIPESLEIKSIENISAASLEENAKSAIHSEFKYEPYVE